MSLQALVHRVRETPFYYLAMLETAFGVALLAAILVDGLFF